MTKITLGGLVLAATFTLIGCQQADTPKVGSYTAARHPMLGSNIPQPDSAATAGYTYDGSIAAAAGGNQALTPSRSAGGAH